MAVTENGRRTTRKDVMRRGFACVASILAGLLSGDCSARGAAGSDYFSLEVPWNTNSPELAEFRLTTDRPEVAEITQLGRAYLYPADAPSRLPETVILRWRVEGETQFKQATFRLRENVSNAALRKIHFAFGGQPDHMLIVRFSVVDGTPECVWAIVQNGPSDSDLLEGGIITGTISPG